MPHRLFCILALGLLAACSDTAPPSETPVNDFGLAVRSNMEAQIIARQGEVTTLGPAPGVRRSLTVGRYQTDQVEPPVKVYTRDE